MSFALRSMGKEDPEQGVLGWGEISKRARAGGKSWFSMRAEWINIYKVLHKHYLPEKGGR
jgi:hypothetical protein